ncbi:Transcription factor [Exophiala xenobiotica]|uniref:Transcription factor n=1 Tax=Lithohypha guttulata TaxID=1690604 RepID=A0ABR0KBP0_9EURO|nr:Transcription factor [Lithohypha guttulata]KAK5319719.1 Transcription factor [Exophiala xenobiotica]
MILPLSLKVPHALECLQRPITDQTRLGKALTSGTKKRNSKSSKPRLTPHQKDTNHKDAENKRRTAIRENFTTLSQVVPGTEGQERSEQVMLVKTKEYLVDSIKEIHQLELELNSEASQSVTMAEWRTPTMMVQNGSSQISTSIIRPNRRRHRNPAAFKDVLRRPCKN